MPNGYGYTDETGQKVSALRDMFDGGGPGQRGDQFRGGGAISALANALKIRPLGSTAPREEIGFRGRIGSREYFRDMFDGGGAGRSSSAGFEGGPYSGLGNVLMDIGLLRPLGAHRGPQAAPMMRPVGLGGVGANPLTNFGVNNGLRPNFDDTPLQGETAGGTGVAPPSDITSTSLDLLTEGGETFADVLAGALAMTGPSYRPQRDILPARPAVAPTAPAASSAGDMRGAPMGIRGLSADQLAQANRERFADMTAFNPVEMPMLSPARASLPLSSPAPRAPAPTMATPPMNPALYNMMARRTGSLLGIGFRPETIMAQSRSRYGVGGF